jgi:N-dimethylarginine dimethylaminohydrolase
MTADPLAYSNPRFLVSAPACSRKRERSHGVECTFGVAWQINPHMRPGAVEPARAVRQHRALVRQLRTLGAIVDIIPFVHGAYDSVFAKDSAVLLRRDGKDHGLMAQPLHPERRAEQSSRRATLESRGFRIAPAPTTPLEGGDVVLRSGAGRPFGYLGHGFRSSRRSVKALERFLDVPITPLELRDPSLYHLDMAVAVLDEASLVCEEALTPSSMRDLKRVVGADSIVRVPLAEARQFALNFVKLPGHVVLASGAPSFERRIQALGYATHGLPLSEFHFAGGSAACLVARVHSMDRATVSTTAAMRSTAA